MSANTHTGSTVNNHLPPVREAEGVEEDVVPLLVSDTNPDWRTSSTQGVPPSLLTALKGFLVLILVYTSITIIFLIMAVEKEKDYQRNKPDSERSDSDSLYVLLYIACYLCCLECVYSVVVLYCRLRYLRQYTVTPLTGPRWWTLLKSFGYILVALSTFLLSLLTSYLLSHMWGCFFIYQCRNYSNRNTEWMVTKAIAVLLMTRTVWLGLYVLYLIIQWVSSLLKGTEQEGTVRSL